MVERKGSVLLGRPTQHVCVDGFRVLVLGVVNGQPKAILMTLMSGVADDQPHVILMTLVLGVANDRPAGLYGGTVGFGPWPMAWPWPL